MFPICLDLSITVSVVNIIQHVQDLSESNERDQKEIGELEEEDLQPVSDIVLHAAGRLLLKVIRGWDLNQLLRVDILKRKSSQVKKKSKVKEKVKRERKT